MDARKVWFHLEKARLWRMHWDFERPAIFGSRFTQTMVDLILDSFEFRTSDPSETKVAIKKCIWKWAHWLSIIRRSLLLCRSRNEIGTKCSSNVRWKKRADRGNPEIITLFRRITEALIVDYEKWCNTIYCSKAACPACWGISRARSVLGSCAISPLAVRWQLVSDKATPNVERLPSYDLPVNVHLVYLQLW